MSTLLNVERNLDLHVDEKLEAPPTKVVDAVVDAFARAFAHSDVPVTVYKSSGQVTL